MPIFVPLDIKTIDQIEMVQENGASNCTVPQGHCYGSDGGSPIKIVPEGRGGEQEIWTLSANKNKIEKREIYSRCQFCGKYIYAGQKE